MLNVSMSVKQSGEEEEDGCNFFNGFCTNWLMTNMLSFRSKKEDPEYAKCIEVQKYLASNSS